MHKFRLLSLFVVVGLVQSACQLDSTSGQVAAETFQAQVENNQVSTRTALTMAAASPLVPPTDPLAISTATIFTTLEPLATLLPPVQDTAIAVINANCRTGPASVYDLVFVMMLGESGIIDGENEDGTWWHIKPDSGKPPCWLTKASVSASGDLGSVDQLDAPPSPTPPLATNLRIIYGQTVSGQTSTSQNSQYWAFYGEAGDNITIRMNSSVFDTFIRLHANIIGAVVASADDCGNLDTCIPNYILEQSGWYFIQATGYDIITGFDYNGSPDVGSYSLTLLKE